MIGRRLHIDQQHYSISKPRPLDMQVKYGILVRRLYSFPFVNPSCARQRMDLDFFTERIKTHKGDISLLKSAFQEAPGTETDKKSIFEQSLRVAIRDHVLNQEENEVDELAELVVAAVKCAEENLCYYSAPFLLLSDAFDCITVDSCEKLFDVVEDNVTTWTKTSFFSSGKILLLRMCNDLLRRLSSSQNTVFCGRIQLFLARLFPLSEKSALNFMSHYNLENVTTYSKRLPGGAESAKTSSVGNDDGMEDMDVEGEEQAITSDGPIDYNLYEKLWSLQDIYRQPTLCFNPEQWKLFIANIQDVLQTFSSYKLEHVQRSKRKRLHSSLEPMESSSSSTSLDYAGSHYFDKYLTSEKLMNLQLSDPHFRRHILLQLLVLFQYLSGEVKFKTHSQVLTDSQTHWIADTTAKVYLLLEETPPDGERFVEYVKHILKTEENWISWKNDGCPVFERQPIEASSIKPPKQEHLGDMLLRLGDEKYLGNKELSRLWNLCPDNLEACSSSERIFVPSVDVFLEEAVEQASSDPPVDPESKMINNPNYTWQALRLLSRDSTHFFQYAAQAQIKPLSEYLENVILLTHKDLPSASSSAGGPS